MSSLYFPNTSVLRERGEYRSEERKRKGINESRELFFCILTFTYVYDGYLACASMHVCVCVNIRAMVSVWRSDDNLGCQFSFSSFLEMRCLHGSLLQTPMLAAFPVFRPSLASTAHLSTQAPGLQVHATAFSLMWPKIQPKCPLLDSTYRMPELSRLPLPAHIFVSYRSSFTAELRSYSMTLFLPLKSPHLPVLS